jgi:hypothetical protein
LDLGAAHLRLVEVVIDTPEPLFRRQAEVAVRELSENTLQERRIARGDIYRVAVAGQEATSLLSLPVEAQVPTRELLLTIQNGDSPPLQVTAVRAVRRPVYLVFLARAAGTLRLFTGNPACDAPNYDVAAQGFDLKSGPSASIDFGPLGANPEYRPPESLPQVQDTGATLDVRAWRFRKPVKLQSAGVQQLELDLEVLAHAQSSFGDIRLLRGDRQMPYVIERTSFTRPLIPEWSRADDPKRPGVSRWSLVLPHSPLPIRHLTCTSPTPLFRRDFVLYEIATDGYGARHRRELGAATWVQSPDRAGKRFVLTPATAPLTGILFLETNNEDNPPIELVGFEMACPVTRICFKSGSLEETWLYFGNTWAVPPRYDLSLVAGQLLSASKQAAMLGPAESLKPSSGAKERWAGRSGVVFWIVLGLAVVALLAIIGRLIPDARLPKG